MTDTAIVTRRAPLVHLRQDRGATNSEYAIVIMRLQSVAEHDLRAVNFHRRKEMAVGWLWPTFRLTADARKIFDIAVPRFEIGVPNRPIDGNSLFQVCFEIEIAPPVALASPGDGLAADLAATNP